MKFSKKDRLQKTLQAIETLFFKIDLKLTALLCLMLVHNVMDTLNRIEKTTDGMIVVQCVDNVSYILAHINLAVPRLVLETGTAIDQVGGKDLIDNTFLIRLIKLFKALSEKAKGGEAED